jgi:hypothetical protein
MSKVQLEPRQIAQTVEGGCFCGEVRYAIEAGTYVTAYCHCSMCRRVSGAASVPWAVVPSTHFRYLQGTPKLLQSSEHGQRFFCDNCGTHVACIITDGAADGHDAVDVPIGTLDNAEPFAPSVEVHTDAKVSWVPLL